MAAIAYEDFSGSNELWIMPNDCLHMTALEVDFSKTVDEIEKLVNVVLPNAERITDYPFDHRARLIKPMVSFDAAALALSFVPASGEALPTGRTRQEDDYTYHHLRRDLFTLCQESGVNVGSRYIVPSAHLTIGRFNSPNVFEVGDALDGNIALDQTLRSQLIEEIKGINDWLEKALWPNENGAIAQDGEWIVGEEFGLDLHKGNLWYGGGERVKIGKGFKR
ncbi:putative 60s ribosomal protein l44 [Phaeomoniella chlamydospora]|uniref:Putative 60s ribosomal protein l44 n=1 Tax=Phaeomoniella chlamydospora TaxID=158046 RepID=A0A0G2F158_PHACM|nr:putative 60s ribosomal protein l44 [Phaeomoniella chlamydospora]